MPAPDYWPWAAAGIAAGALVLARVLGGRLVVGDLRGRASLTPEAASHTRRRSPDRVDAVVLHQMGFSRGSDPRQYLGVTSHYVILPDGGVYQLHDWSTVLPASNGFNSRSVSVEFAGNFPSRSRSTDPSRWWYPSGHNREVAYQNQLTTAQVDSGRALLAALRERGVRRVLAHRQSSGQRGNDPGPDVWGAVAEYGIRDLGMVSEPAAIDNGDSIPQHWRDAYAAW